MQKGNPEVNNIFQHTIKGEGNNYSFAFNGVGQTRDSLIAWQKLNPQNQIFLISISADWMNNHLLDEQIETLFINYIVSLLHKYQIDTFSIMANSIGARPAIILALAFPAKVSKIVLIAPDGIHSNFLFRFATRTKTGRFLLEYTLKKPKFIKSILDVSKKLPFIRNQSVFAQSQIRTEKQRIALKAMWLVYGQMKPNRKGIVNTLNAFSIPLEMFIGKQDGFIPNSRLIEFSSQLEYCTLIVLEARHEQVFSRAMRYLEEK